MVEHPKSKSTQPRYLTTRVTLYSSDDFFQAALQTCEGDRPLIVQFCANDPETFRRAVEHTVRIMKDNLPDAIDLNLGCPQVIARRGHFGSFLQEDWDLVSEEEFDYMVDNFGKESLQKPSKTYNNK